MSHRSRLTAVLVDVPQADHERAVSFWSGAVGRAATYSEQFPEYAQLGEVTPGVDFVVQATGTGPPRVHLDIETDDVEAEVQRLAALGATELERHHTWVIMRDPVGVVFCVVRVQLPASFDAHATAWPPGP